VPIVAGMVISFIVHGMKATARPVVNTATVGLGAPVASTAEDIVSVVMSFFAILLPFLIIFFVAGLIWAFVALRRRRRRRKAALRADEQLAVQGPHDDRTLDLWGRQ